MRKIKVGIIGMGYIGVSHIEALRRIGNIEITALADVNIDLAKQRAETYHIGRYFATVEELLAASDVDVIHNCTPNNLHATVSEKILRAGKHIFSEKPLARTTTEADMLLKLLKNCPQVVTGVNFNYRMNPLIQEMRHRIARGDIGVPRLIHGSYLQDWLLYKEDYNWRIDPEISGPSNCIADIGSHWMDLAQHLLNTRITEVCADLLTVIPVRNKPTRQAEAFAKNVSEEYEEKSITTEDYAAVLFKMENGVHGVFCVSQVSAGHG